MTEYNKKEFLLPYSIHSCALYHAKVFEDGTYLFRIHDCVGGVRLRGDLNKPHERQEAIDKTATLIRGLEEFREFVIKMAIENDKER